MIRIQILESDEKGKVTRLVGFPKTEGKEIKNIRLLGAEKKADKVVIDLLTYKKYNKKYLKENLKKETGKSYFLNRKDLVKGMEPKYQFLKLETQTTSGPYKIEVGSKEKCRIASIERERVLSRKS